MGRKLPQYAGRLTPAQVAAGMNAAQANARRLLASAEALLAANCYPAAASLAALSIEESGKTGILRELALAHDDQAAAAAWRRFRYHTSKNAIWLVPQKVAAGARFLEDFRSLFQPESEHPSVLDKVKQLGFYTDCLGDAHWSSPEQVVDEPLARSLVAIAGCLTSQHEVTESEITLWVQHMGPVWGGPLDLMRRALVTWYAELLKLGLHDGDPKDMAEFVFQSSNEVAQQGDEADER
jgi:AbiV family abortive infection protein